MKTVGEVMRKGIPAVTSEDTVRKAAKLMRENHIGGLPVVENGQVVGILTDGDILSAFYLNVSSFSYEEKAGDHNGGSAFANRLKEFHGLKVNELMTSRPRCIGEKAGVDEAAGLIKRFRIKRLIVTNDRGEYTGIVERLDVVDSILSE